MPARRTWSGSRSRVPGSSTSTSRPPGCTTCCARSSRTGEALRPRPRARRPAHQPRVRLGQPDRPAARGRRALGRGRRRARQPPRGAGRGRAPRVLPERRRQPARHLRAPRCSPATAGEAPPEDGYQGEYLVDMAERHAGRARRRRHRGAGAGVGRTATAVRGPPGRPRRASACTSTPGSPSARCTRRATSTRVLDDLAGPRRRVRRATAPRWLRATDFGDQRDRVLVKSDGTTTYLCNDLAYHRDKFERGLGAPHRHLGRRPPRPGEVAAGGDGGARLPRGRARGAARPAREARAATARRCGSRSAPATSSRSPTSSTRSTPTSRG